MVYYYKLIRFLYTPVEELLIVTELDYGEKKSYSKEVS